MGYRRSTTYDSTDNNPDKKHVPASRGVNEHFMIGIVASTTARGAGSSVRIPVGRKPGRNKATK